MVLDDLDTTVAEAQSLLEHLAAMRPNAPVCVVATTASIEEKWRDRTRGDVHVRVLDGLSRTETSDLLTIISGATRPSTLVDSVFADTAGDPSLIVAIGRRLRDADITTRVDGALSRAEAARRGLTEVRDEVAFRGAGPPGRVAATAVGCQGWLGGSAFDPVPV